MEIYYYLIIYSFNLTSYIILGRDIYLRYNNNPCLPIFIYISLSIFHYLFYLITHMIFQPRQSPPKVTCGRERNLSIYRYTHPWVASTILADSKAAARGGIGRKGRRRSRPGARRRSERSLDISAKHKGLRTPRRDLSRLRIMDGFAQPPRTLLF